METHSENRLKQASDQYPDKPFALGLPWYAPESYAACRARFADGDTLPATSEQWLPFAERAERDAVAQGLRVIRVLIQPEPMQRWCRRREVSRIDTVARVEYATWGAAECLRAERAEQNADDGATEGTA